MDRNEAWWINLLRGYLDGSLSDEIIYRQIKEQFSALESENKELREEISNLRIYCTLTFGESHPEIKKCPHELELEENLAENKELRAENDNFKTWGIIEIMVRNPSVNCFVAEKEAQIKSLETKLERMRDVLKEADDYLTYIFGKDCSNYIGTNSILHKKFKESLLPAEPKCGPMCIPNRRHEPGCPAEGKQTE